MLNGYFFIREFFECLKMLKNKRNNMCFYCDKFQILYVNVGDYVSDIHTM